MKQLGVPLKQKSSIIFLKRPKERKKEENQDNQGCWLSVKQDFTWEVLGLPFCHLGGQLSILRVLEEEVIYTDATEMNFKGFETIK